MRECKISLPIVPPEDLLCFEISTVETQSVFIFGSNVLSHSTLLGVEHSFCRFRFGHSVKLIGVWSSSFETPRFTVDAYLSENTTVIALLSEEDIAVCQAFENLFQSVVSLDSSEVVKQFATSRGLPLFEGLDALYWAFYHTLTQ